MTKPRLSHWSRMGINLVGLCLGDFFWNRWVKYVSDPSTSEPCGSFAQDDQVGRSTLLKDDQVGRSTFLQCDCSWEVHCSLRLWNLEGSATGVNQSIGCRTPYG